ncbi:MAG: phage tail protein [Myxococcales bacterium]|nr:phage tail protein [Myxococcales bacterium]
MSRREALPVYYFAVEIKGIQQGFFRSCAGLKSESEVVTIQEGGVNTTELKLMGVNKYSNIILKQGFVGPELWSLRQNYVNDEPGKKMQRIDGLIVHYGPGGKRLHKWRFRKAWICKWEGPEFDATKNEISVETIEIAHEELTYEG